MKSTIITPDYKKSSSTIFDYLLTFAVGFAAGFLIAYVFYKIVAIAIAGGTITAAVNAIASNRKARVKRINKLRVQFFDLLEAMSVAMRAGNTMPGSLKSAREDLTVLYEPRSDIIKELDLIIGRFNNAMPLSEAFSDMAKRSGLEDIGDFASVYKTIEGKSGRANEIVQETQQIISDKMEIEMEIDTMMTGAKMEVNIMLMMPLVILGIIGYAGAGFMDAIYTTVAGRIVSTFGLVIFIISYLLATKYSNVKL